MHSKADEPYEDEEEYDDAREIVEDADVAIVAQLTSDRSLLSSESAALTAAVETNEMNRN